MSPQSVLLSYEQRLEQANSRLLDIGRMRHHGQLSASDYWIEVEAIFEFVEILANRRTQELRSARVTV